MATETKSVKTDKKPAPTLYFIAAIKLIKGLALLLLALKVFTLANRDLSDTFDQFLRWVHLDPERAFFAWIGDWLDTITPANVRAVASGTFLCGLFLVIEAVGLAFRAKWAIWLAIGESAFFIPIEIFELIPKPNAPHHYSLGLSIVLVINVAVVWYLYQNRERLFRHH
jgi:uncharacterized membrane protein (DUF2068 family)